MGRLTPEPAPAEATPMRCPSCGVHTLPPVPVWRCPDAACGDSLVGPPMDPVMASQRRESASTETPPFDDAFWREQSKQAERIGYLRGRQEATAEVAQTVLGLRADLEKARATEAVEALARVLAAQPYGHKRDRAINGACLCRWCKAHRFVPDDVWAGLSSGNGGRSDQ